LQASVAASLRWWDVNDASSSSVADVERTLRILVLAVSVEQINRGNFTSNCFFHG
jgi:hypothetical protein